MSYFVLFNFLIGIAIILIF